MSSKLDLWNAVKGVIVAAQATGQPLAFMAANSFYDGIYPNLEDLPPESFPAIMMEPDKDDEKWFTTGVPPAIKSEMSLFLSCMVFEAQANKGIIGDATLTPPLIGILEFVDTVKNVLQADQRLGFVAGQQKLYFPSTQFFYEAYPIREGKIKVVLESQLTTTSH